MTSKKRLSKTKKALLFLVGIVIILITAIIIVADNYIEGEVRKQIDQQFNNNPESLYNITVEDIGISVLGSGIYLENIQLSPKELAADSLNNAKLKSLISGNIESFDLKGLKIIKFLKEKTINIRKISVEGANIDYLINPAFKSDEKLDSHGLNNIFSDAFKGAMVDKLEILNTNVRFTDHKQTDNARFEIDSLSIYLSNVEFDKSTAENFLPLNFEDLTIDTKHFSIKSLKYYDIYTSGIELDLHDSTLVINGFEFLPTLGRSEYNNQLAYEADLYSFKTKKIRLNGFDIKDIIMNNRIILSSVEIHTLYANIYRDKTLDDPPFKAKPLFASIVRKIPIKTVIDSLLIIDSKLIYEEKQKLTDIPGIVSFDKLNIRVANITNDSHRLEKNKYLPIHIEGRLMSEGNIIIDLKVDLKSKTDEFKATGMLGPISGIAFNSLTKNLLLAEIQMGDIHSAWFSYNANDDKSLGQLKIDYENLQLQGWKVDKEKKAKFMTFLGNKVIRKSNMPDDPKYRTGVVSFTRDKNKGIPNFLWKSVMSGLISILAPVAENKEQREITKKNKKEKRVQKKLNKKSN